MKRLALAAVVLVASHFACEAPARADAPPATFFSVDRTYLSSSSYLDQNGHTQPSSCTFVKNSTSVYAERRMGARDLWFADTSYDVDSCGAASTRGLNDIEAGIQHGIGHANPTLWNVRASLIVPGGYDVGANPSIGLGRPGATLGLTYLSNFRAGRGHYGYVTGGASVRAYTSYPAPQLLTNFTAGYHATPGLLLYESYYGVTHLGAGGQLRDVGLNPTISSSYASYQLSSNAVFALTGSIGLHFAVWNLLGGENYGTGNEYFAGLWVHLR